MTDKMNQDLLHRYLFDKHHVRGELVQVNESFNAMLENHNYPEVVKKVLGELLSATCLLTATLKFEGDISVQLQGDGPLQYAVVNGNHEQKMRAVARFNDQVQGETIQDLFGKGYMVITISPLGGEKYQGVAPLDHPTLAQCIEHYFETSEQLSTRVWLATSLTEQDNKAAGMLLQVLPVEDKAEQDFQHLEALTATIKDEEMLDLPAEQVLVRLYHEDNPQLFAPQPVCYECGCSREKTADAILKLSHEDANALIEERGNIEIICQFCLTQYLFDAVDVDALFNNASENSSTIN